ncbi:2S sulfur-rich seed storage protein 2-like [Impatiens glandulifera]|uniref:2S sulfur-rich seed storage protein 2-like n=1 Tax=Impatiens glandulifera TaxID=253017 RepID=UPI001FB19735|nr:2S sulfur-rich seed storage protein 2-like [Impatiens glandulifera]
MMKLTIVSALLLVVVLTTGEASTSFRTSIIEEEAARSTPMRMEAMCMEQMMSQQMLSQCRMYVEKMMHKSLMNPTRGEEEECMDMCCQQLRSMDQECRCDAFKVAVHMPIQREQRDISKMTEEKIMREAERMYSQCNLSPRTCHMSRSA